MRQRGTAWKTTEGPIDMAAIVQKARVLRVRGYNFPVVFVTKYPSQLTRVALLYLFFRRHPLVAEEYYFCNTEMIYHSLNGTLLWKNSTEMQH